MVTLGLILAVGVILALGLTTFEINRLELAREQLRVACDAASLAAAATLASSDNVDVTTAQNQAIATALTTFQANSVLGTSLSSSSTTTSSSATPTANQALIYVQLLDPHNNNAAVAVGNAAGKIISVSATFGVVPAFGQFLGIGQIPVTVNSSGGVPDLDVVLCFDVSASIDDQTPVTFVRRRWDSVNGVIAYDVASTSTGSPAGNLAQGTIFDILGPPATGSSVNAQYPQQLSSSNNGQSTYPLAFSEVHNQSGSAPGLRGATNAGSPPGNYPPGTAGIGNTHTYTDLVVNIDGKTQFAGLTSNGYKFPDLATVVEAMRGNLENNAVFTSSKANTGVPANVQPTAGYQAEYFRLAAINVHPLYDAQQAAQQFYTVMNTNTDAHFGLVSFTTNAGTSSSSTYSTDNVDGSYSAGGTGSFPVPTIPLSNVGTTTNYSTIIASLPNTVAVSSTNIGDALNKAVTELKNNSRSGSKKAIVLFTDGQPTAGGPLDNDPWLNARKAAVLAQKAGIPIYTIGLAQTPAIIPGETSILNDTNSNATTGGVAAIAGNGGKFFLVTKTADLRYTFENIARQLVQLVQ
jgi:hypothetical protein